MRRALHVVAQTVVAEIVPILRPKPFVDHDQGVGVDPLQQRVVVPVHDDVGPVNEEAGGADLHRGVQ